MTREYARRYTSELLEPLVRESKSRAEVIRRLGLRVSGGTDNNLRRHIQEYDLDTSHFGQRTQGLDSSRGWNKRSFSEILVLGNLLDRREKGSVLTRAMVEAGIPHECKWCKNHGVWRGPDGQLRPLRLHVDHRNGHSYDNRIENLRFLCPNCHDTTPSWGNSNKPGTIWQEDDGSFTLVGDETAKLDLVIEQHAIVPEQVDGHG